MNNTNFILVTGASSGIGSRIAIQLAENSPVILHGRDKIKLQNVFQACCGRHPILVWQYDLSEIGQIDNEFSSFLLSNGAHVSAFVHCAGNMRLLPLKMVTINTMQSIFNINVFSAAILCHVLTRKRSNGDALKNIVFISSNISNFGAKAFSTYAASKGALDAFMRCLAVELAPTVRVNSVLPGAIRTEMTENIFSDEERAKKLISDYPLGIGRVGDIAGIVSFLLSDSSRWITGQQIVVDGGRSINISG